MLFYYVIHVLHNFKLLLLFKFFIGNQSGKNTEDGAYNDWDCEWDMDF